ITSIDYEARTITLASTAGIAAGDVLKIVSDDRLLGSRPAEDSEDYRQGQYVVVTEVDGTDVIVNERLRFTFTTNPRLAKLSGHTLGWKGGRVRYEPNITSVHTCFDIYNAVNPHVRDIRFGYLPGIAVSL